MQHIPPGILIGCGITAFDVEDATRMLMSVVFKDKELPGFSVIENVDVSTLDGNHVLPNMLPPNRRGVWFPMGYDQY